MTNARSFAGAQAGTDVTADPHVGELTQAVVFRLDDRRYALPLGCVERVVRAAEVTALPGAPAIVLGALCVEGRVLPVLDLRRRFGLPTREIGPADHFLICRTGARSVLLVIDEADGVIDPPPADVVAAADVLPGLDHVKGVAKLEDGLVLIQDPEKFLSLDEARSLDEAMAGAP